MIQALILKELRDALGLAAIAAAVFALLIARQVGVPLAYWSRPLARFAIPFVGDEFPVSFGLIAYAFAISLAFRQVARELSQETLDVLLMRPLRRSTIFAVKMALGNGLLVAISASAIVAYAAWAMTPGATPTPFRWSMTFPTWIVFATLPTIYLGAFLSSLRPAKWFGTRLLPLAGAVYTSMIAVALTSACGTVAFALMAAADVALVIAISHIGNRRDY